MPIMYFVLSFSLHFIRFSYTCVAYMSDPQYNPDEASDLSLAGWYGYDKVMTILC